MSERSLDEYIALVKENLPRVREDIARYGHKDVTLMAATKTVPVEAINYAIDHLGLTDIGENRVQELLEKYEALHKENLRIHFIGRLQTNKVKYIIDKVCLIHSVDSEKLAAEIDRQAQKHALVMDILVELNIGREESKGGIFPEALPSFLDSLAQYKHIRVVGLMTIPPPESDSAKTREYFAQTYQIFIDILQKKLHNISKYVLSTGMSDSYVEALKEGATLIRPGSALFGRRFYPEKTAP